MSERIYTLDELVARHRYGPHRCVGMFTEGTTGCIVNRLADVRDDARAVVVAYLANDDKGLMGACADLAAHFPDAAG